MIRPAAGRRPSVRLAVVSFLSLALALPALAGTLTGQVTTEGGAAAEDALVRLTELHRAERVDDAGRFEFADLPAGEYLVEFISRRHGSAVRRVEVEADRTVELDVRLELAAHDQTVVVTASPHVRSQLELATPTSVVGDEELDLFAAPTLGDSLTHLPGVHSTSFGPGASRPVIRGLSGDRVRVLQSGIDSGDASGVSPDHAVSIDPQNAERIEVLRGPATLLYGSSAIGGVVNVFDGRIPEYLPSRPVEGEVELRLGSVSDERGGSARLDGRTGSLAWHADALLRDTDEYEIPGFAATEDVRAEDEDGEEFESGVLSNSDLETTSGSVGLSYFFGSDGFIGASIAGLDTEYGIPGDLGHGHEEEEGEHEEEEEEHEEGEEEEGPVRIDMEQRRLDLKGEVTRPFGMFRGLRARFGLTDYEHVELEGEEVGTRFFNDFWEGRVEFIQRERGRLSGSFGLQLDRREFEAIGAEAFVPPTESFSYALFAYEELAWNELRLQFGGRLEHREVEAEVDGGVDRDFDGVSGSVGLVWLPNDTYSMGLSIARSTKLPTPEELFSSGVHVATQAFELGDPDLDEETSLGIDLSLRKLRGRLSGELNLFTNRFSDYIFGQLTDPTTMPTLDTEEFSLLVFTQEDATFTGAEIDLRVGLFETDFHDLDWTLSADTVRAELRRDDSPLPRIPPARYGTGLRYRGHGLQAMIEVRHVTDQDRTAAEETPTDSYTMLDASVGYAFALSAGRSIELLLRGANLTDETARNHVSFLKDVVPLPGREIGLTARFRF